MERAALGAWPWGLASWHQQRAATATAAASSGGECMLVVPALSRMLLWPVDPSRAVPARHRRGTPRSREGQP